MSTTTRLLELLSLLQTQREWRGPELASRLDVSDRTVRRDIDRLREMGYRIQATMGPVGGYRLQAGTELPPLLFDEDQTVAIAVALQAVTGVGVEDAAERALATIRQVLPSDLRHRLDTLEITPVARPERLAIATDELQRVAGAIRAGEVLRFDYASPGQDATTRRVEPRHLVTTQGRWYLLAWDLDRSDWRLFRLDRMTPRIPTGPRFAPRAVPGGDVDGFVSARFRGADGDGWPCRGSVILDLPIRDVLPFVGDGAARALGDERSILEAGSWSWPALAASFGRFDAPMQVIGPPELADAFAALSGRYADAAASSASRRSRDRAEA